MTTLDIINVGHPTLREIAAEIPVDEIKSAKIQRLIDDLIDTKRAANGAGIAASQVNVALRLFVVEAGSNPKFPFKPAYPLTVMINPKISFQTAERFENFEGCLSIPGLRGVVHRCPVIRVQGYNRDAEKVDFEIRGVSAGIFQHEDDHLNGVLYTDKLTDTKTLCTVEEFSTRYEKKYKEMVVNVEQAYGPV